MPAGLGALYSVFSWNGLARGGFVGLENFRDVLFQQPFTAWTYNALTHNIIVFVADGGAERHRVPASPSLLKALPGHRFHQVAIFLPVVFSTVIIGALWKLFLNPALRPGQPGPASRSGSGGRSPGSAKPETALGSLILVNIWHWLGFPALRLPRRHAAHQQGGAGGGAARRRRRLDADAPDHLAAGRAGVRPSWSILTFIGSFNWFELPYVMAGLDGSPGGATDVLGLYFYRTAFGSATSGLQDFGRGSALAVLMFLFIAIVSVDLALGRCAAARSRSSGDDGSQRSPSGIRHCIQRSSLARPPSIMLYPMVVVVLVRVQDDGGDLQHAFRSAAELQPRERRDDLARARLSRATWRIR